jgi:glycosyltransferase involved in cell wall biosynthesis
MERNNEMDDSLVSVVIPTKNRPQYLRQAIASVYAQSYPHFEIIVVDDGSSDAVAEHLRDYDDRLRCYRQPARGAAAARNLGISKAKGAFIAFLDDDDFYAPDKLQSGVDFFAQHPRIDWLCTGFFFVDGAGEPMPREAIVHTMPYLTAHDIALFTFISTSTIMVRAPRLRQVGGFDETMGVSEDYALWAKLVLHSRCGVLAAALSSFRLHKGNTRLPYWTLLRANTAIIDGLIAAKAEGLEPRAFYKYNLDRIIAESLLYKRHYFQYVLFRLGRVLRGYSTT